MFSKVHLAMYVFSATKLAKDINCLEEFEGGSNKLEGL